MELTFEQWVHAVLAMFRTRYLGVARRAFPHLEEALPLARAGRLTVVQVNAGQAVHFIWSRAQGPEATACRALTLTPPEGHSVRDWAFLDEEGYKRFVARAVEGEHLAHLVLFPGEGDEHAAASLEAERAAREHAAGLRGP